MKKILFILLLIPLMANAEEIKLLTWNVFMLPKPINFSRQKERTKLIASELLESEFDIILLQEAFLSGFRGTVAETLKKKYPHQEHLRKSTRLLHFLNSGLFVASRYPFEVLGHYYFNACTHSDCFAAKGILLIEVTTQNGKKVQIGMTHLQAWNDKKAITARREQINDVKNIFSKFYKEGVPQILAGDLNINAKEETEYPEIISFLEMSNSPLEGTLTATNGHAVDCYKTPGKPSEGDWIDHIWLRANNSETKILGKKVHQFFGIMSDKTCPLSDHHGLEAIIQL